MILLGEIGGRRQRARVSSARMHAVGRRTMHVHIPGLHGPARWAVLTASQAIAHTRSARLARSLRPAWDRGARNPGCDVSWVRAGVAGFSSPQARRNWEPATWARSLSRPGVLEVRGSCKPASHHSTLPPLSPDLMISQEKPEIICGCEISFSVLALFDFILFSYLGFVGQIKQM